MESWDRPVVPRLQGEGSIPRLFDSHGRRPVAALANSKATLYVCGITPYDATHIGHVSTYLAFDTIARMWLDAGLEVEYTQNVTDVDEPLLERAAESGVDWRDLAASQVAVFRSDMAALRFIPPDHFVAVTEIIPEISRAVARLIAMGVAYRVDEDIYFDSAAAATDTWALGDVSGLDRATMRALSAERGGDPDRPGKRDQLDPLLWRAERPGEPRWPSEIGSGRPGWHIECSVIAQQTLGVPLSVNGGGSDLAFPHHEFSAGHTAALSGRALAAVHAHTGMVSLDGEKMSKSLGNLVLVSDLLEAGADPQAIRLAVLAHHYREDWEWTADQLGDAATRLAEWSRAKSGQGISLVSELREALADDVDTPRALSAIDAQVAEGRGISTAEREAIDALLGIRL
jgi:L-cysteine:1D-myo-inositol 2-amino-2-deoxy-alpha-D-glucopyranoside ligase